MCECLLETYEKTVITELEICELLVHTTYRLGLEPVDPLGISPRADAQTEVCVTWEEK
jgi:hypothetical protein